MRLLQSFERAFVLCDRLAGIATRRSLRFLHLVGSLVELATQFCHLRIATLTRQTLELARCFARLFDQLLLLSLITTRSVRRSLLHATTLFFECCLLSSRELFETPFGFALLLLGLLLLRALNGLVLVLHLVELELEQARQLLLLALATAAATLLIAESDLHFAEDRVCREQTL